jgi:hypothetical protein
MSEGADLLLGCATNASVYAHEVRELVERLRGATRAYVWAEVLAEFGEPISWLGVSIPSYPDVDLLVARLEEHSYSEVLKHRTEEELWDAGLTFVAGASYKDGFGSWMHIPGDAVFVTAEPPALYGPRAAEAALRPRYHLDVVGVGQPDGPGSDGVIFAARLWNLRKEKQTGPVFVGDDIDWAAAAAVCWKTGQLTV